MDPQAVAPAPQGARRRVTASPFVFGVLLAALGLLQAPRAADLPTMLGMSASIAVGALVVLIVLSRSRHLPTPPVRLWAPATLLACSATVSVVVSPSPIEAMPRAMLYLALVLLMTAIVAIHRDAGWSLVPWLLVVALVSGALAGVAFVDMAQWPAAEQKVHAGTLVNARRTAGIAFLAASACGGLALLRPRWRPVLLPSLLFLVFVIVASGSRGPLLAWVLFVGLIGVLSAGGARRTFVLDSLGVLTVASTVVLVLHHSGVWESHNVFVRLAENAAAAGADLTTGRLHLWGETIGLMDRSPLFGSGPDAFRILAPDVGVIYPHNIVLQLLLEFGPVGCVLGVVTLACGVSLLGGIARIRHAIAASAAGQVLTALLVADLLLGLVDGPLYWMLPLVHFAALAGLWCAAVSSTPD